MTGIGDDGADGRPEWRNAGAGYVPEARTVHPRIVAQREAEGRCVSCGNAGGAHREGCGA